MFLTLGISFGEGAVAEGTAGSFLGPLTIGAGFVIGGIVGVAAAYIIKDKSKTKYTIEVDSDNVQAQINSNSKEKAPGIPTAKDGFMPPKKWDGKKIKNPNGGGYGWPDVRGRVWIPSGPNGHGGAHWDVQNPDGSHDNILPGGGNNDKNK